MHDRAGGQSALTFRQRRQLAAPWRELATEDPELAGGLSGTPRPGRRPAGDTVARWRVWTGICLPIGVILTAGHLVALAVVLLSTFWMPVQGDRLDGMRVGGCTTSDARGPVPAYGAGEGSSR